MQTSLLRSIVFAALVSGCAGTGQFTVTGEATVPPPELVVISPGVQVIADLDQPVFYSGNYYWRNDGGAWYRSTSHTHGWARVEVAPVEIRAIERPAAYVHYHGEARAHVSNDRRPPPPQPVERERRHDDDKRHDDDRRHDDDKRHDDKHHDDKHHDDNDHHN
jgi:hypothetical protein